MNLGPEPGENQRLLFANLATVGGSVTWPLPPFSDTAAGSVSVSLSDTTTGSSRELCLKSLSPTCIPEYGMHRHSEKAVRWQQSFSEYLSLKISGTKPKSKYLGRLRGRLTAHCLGERWPGFKF